MWSARAGSLLTRSTRWSPWMDHRQNQQTRSSAPESLLLSAVCPNCPHRLFSLVNQLKVQPKG